MTRLDPTKTWRKVEERLAHEKDDRKHDADGMLLAEDAYTATDGFANLRKLTPDELPLSLVSS